MSGMWGSAVVLSLGQPPPGNIRDPRWPTSSGVGSYLQSESPRRASGPLSGPRGGLGYSASGPAGAWSREGTRGGSGPRDFGPNALLSL